MMSKPHIGILTWHDPTNCGSALQAYALHYYLRKLGYDTKIIRYVPRWCRGDYMLMPWNTISKKRKIKRWAKESLLPFYDILPNKLHKSINPFLWFYYKHCKMTTACTEESIAKVCKPFTTIISGSDQVWNPCFIDPTFLQDFVTWDVLQMSYAACLGGKDMPEELADTYKKCLSSFSAISVREDDGQQMLKSIGVNSDVLIDPTLLLDATHYRSIAKPVKGINKPFAFCYFLPTERNYKESVQEYLHKHNLEAVGFSANKQDYSWIKEVAQMGPNEWLWLIDNAEVVLTNSYHATIFSLLHHTPFYTFVRFTPDDPVCQNSRIEQLDKYFNIRKYLVNDAIPAIDNYDFHIFDNRLSGLQATAKNYLMTNIK